MNNVDWDKAGSSAKKYFLASRALMESMLRPYGLGNTQWYVLFRLNQQSPVSQRELTRELDVERATLSAVVAALVRKGHVEQRPDPVDQRQKLLHITPSGTTLWESLPDPAALITGIAFGGMNPVDIATMNRVLNDATTRLLNFKKENR